jgi:hypothetical protein
VLQVLGRHLYVSPRRNSLLHDSSAGSPAACSGWQEGMWSTLERQCILSTCSNCLQLSLPSLEQPHLTHWNTGSLWVMCPLGRNPPASLLVCLLLRSSKIDMRVPLSIHEAAGVSRCALLLSCPCPLLQVVAWVANMLSTLECSASLPYPWRWATSHWAGLRSPACLLTCLAVYLGLALPARTAHSSTASTTGANRGIHSPAGSPCVLAAERGIGGYHRPHAEPATTP